MTSLDRPPVLGWLIAAGHPGRAWPGVLLHRDALLVRAPREVLVKAAGELGVVIGPVVHAGSDRTANAEADGALPVCAVKVLEIDGWPDEPATAMLRLADDSGVDVSTHVNRGGFEIAIRVTGDVWKAFESLGLVPDDIDEQESPIGPQQVTQPATTLSLSVETIAVRPASWCDIFWWLC